MAPADINLGQTRRWLAQLHTTNLPPASSSSSTHSGSGSTDFGNPSASPSYALGSLDLNSSSASDASPMSPTSAVSPVSPLTEARARSLQRLCEIGTANNTSLAAPAGEPAAGDINARFTPNNINYIKESRSSWSSESASGMSPLEASPTRGQSRWSRKSSTQSLEAVEGESMRRFSLSRFRLR